MTPEEVLGIKALGVVAVVLGLTVAIKPEFLFAQLVRFVPGNSRPTMPKWLGRLYRVMGLFTAAGGVQVLLFLD